MWQRFIYLIFNGRKRADIDESYMCSARYDEWMPEVSESLVSPRRESLCIFPLIALTAMWMQKGKVDNLRKSLGIRASYCRRIVPDQALEKKLLAIPVRRMLRLAAGCLYAYLAVILYARIITPACAPQHPCWPTHLFKTFTYTHLQTFTHIHTHTYTYTLTYTHVQTFTHAHTRLY